LINVSKNIHFPDPTIIPPEILEQPGTLYPYFKDVIGAADGTHIPAKVPVEKVPHF